MDKRQQLFALQERELRDKLPDHWKEPWDEESENKIASIPKHDGRATVRWEGSPLGLCKPASRAMMLSHVLAYRDAGASLPNPVDDWPGLLDHSVTQAILDGPLLDHAAATRAMTLRYAASFATRCMGLEASSLFIAAKRILAEEPRTDRSELLREYAEYWDIARSMDPKMEPGEQHGPDTAIRSGRAATAIIAVEVAPRAGELVSLERSDITVVDDRVIVVIQARFSKSNVSQVRDLSLEGSAIVKDYVERARPFLIGRADPLFRLEVDSGSEPLWLSGKGLPLTSYGVLAVLRQNMHKRVGNRVCCNFLRSALVSQKNIDQTLSGDLIGHRIGSNLANDRYATKDYKAAIADMAEIWTIYD
jgi:integrase